MSIDSIAHHHTDGELAVAVIGSIGKAVVGGSI